MCKLPVFQKINCSFLLLYCALFQLENESGEGTQNFSSAIPKFLTKKQNRNEQKALLGSSISESDGKTLNHRE